MQRKFLIGVQSVHSGFPLHEGVPCVVVTREGEHDNQGDTQKTAKGYEVPVPTRGDFMRDLQKVAPPLEPPEEPEDDEA